MQDSQHKPSPSPAQQRQGARPDLWSIQIQTCHTELCALKRPSDRVYSCPFQLLRPPLSMLIQRKHQHCSCSLSRGIDLGISTVGVPVLRVMSLLDDKDWAALGNHRRGVSGSPSKALPACLVALSASPLIPNSDPSAQTHALLCRIGCCLRSTHGALHCCDAPESRHTSLAQSFVTP